MSQATPSTQSHRQQSEAGPPDEPDPTAEQPSEIAITLQRVDALDHYEALVLLERSGVMADDIAPEGLDARIDRLLRAMDAAESLCGLVEDPSITITVALTRPEAATLMLAHVVAAAHYRSEDCPDTAVVYERAAASLLSTMFDHVEDP